MKRLHLFRRFKRWVRSRSYRRLLPALPGFLACLVLGAFAFLLTGWRPIHTEARYTEMAKSAFINRDWELARVAYQRLMRLGGEPRPEYLFRMSLCLVGLGRAKDGTDLLAQLAPLEKPGYREAHLFLARNLLAQTNSPQRAMKAAERHLLHVVSLDPESIEANDMLGRIYFRTMEWDLAKKHLMQVVSAKPEAALLMAGVLRAQGDEGEARNWADRAAKYYRGKAAEARPDDPAPRLGWAEATVMLKDFGGALSILETGWRQSGNRVFQTAMAEVCAGWVKALAKDSPGDLSSRLKLIQQGLQHAPQNESLLTELIALAGKGGPEAVQAQGAVNKLLAEGGASAVLHFLLGVDAWARKEVEQARQHFGLAFELTPTMPYVANNMALIMSLAKEPDLPRALAIIEPVVEKYPKNPHFRDTRGQILVKMGRYREGVTELEAALTTLANKRSIHATLAEAYEKLGMKNLAAEHAKLAREDEEPAPESEGPKKDAVPPKDTAPPAKEPKPTNQEPRAAAAN